MLMLGETCLKIKKKNKFLENQLLKNKSMKKLSENVRNCAVSLRVWQGETLISLHKQNTIISGLNMENLSMLLKFQMAMMQQMMFGMYTTMKKFLIKCGKYQNSLITDDNRKLIISSNFYSKWKNSFKKQMET